MWPFSCSCTPGLKPCGGRSGAGGVRSFSGLCSRTRSAERLPAGPFPRTYREQYPDRVADEAGYAYARDGGNTIGPAGRRQGAVFWTAHPLFRKLSVYTQACIQNNRGPGTAFSHTVREKSSELVQYRFHPPESRHREHRVAVCCGLLAAALFPKAGPL